MGYTLEQLQKMGAKPIQTGTPTATPAKKYTVEELQKVGATPVSSPTPTEPQGDGFLKSVAKGIVKPVATLAARPIQLGAELLGASAEQVDSATKKVAGDWVAPTPKGIGDVVKDVGRAAETISLGVGGGAVKSGIKGLAKQGAIQGAKSGALYGGGSAMEEGKGVGGVIKETAIGAVTGGALGGALGGAVPAGIKSVNAIRNLHVERATRAAQEFENLAGKIVQGKPVDIASAKKVLSEIDSKGIRSYSDLGNALDDKIEAISGKLDGVLETDPYSKVLDEWKYKAKAGGAEIEHNFVEDAIKQMDEFYTKVNDVQGKAELAQLREKAMREGLSTKEINDLARLHGRKLNGFNANGELASGLSKVAAENTRKGLKATARQQFNHPLYKEADGELTKLLNVRSLVTDMETAVNKLQQKVKTRSVGEKLGRVIGKVMDVTSGGILKGTAQYFLPRGEGLKVLNALDLESQLSKNLKKLQSIADSDTMSEDQIIQKLEQFLSDHGMPASSPASLNQK